MRSTIANMWDPARVPGLQEAVAREKGILLLAVKDGVALVGVRLPLSREQWLRNGILAIADQLWFESKADRFELVELEPDEFEEILATASKKRGSS